MSNKNPIAKQKIVEAANLITETFMVNNVPAKEGISALILVLCISVKKTHKAKATFDELYTELKQLYEEMMALDQKKKG